MRPKQIFIELLIVFVGVLGAFLAESKLQSLQDYRTDRQTLLTIYQSIKEDSIRINNYLKSDSITLKERTILADRFIIWESSNEGPRDSLELLLNYMGRTEFKRKINIDILQTLPNISTLKNDEIKFKILTYYNVASRQETMYEEWNISNINLIRQTIDMSTFSGYYPPPLNSKFKGRRVTLDKLLNIELRNNCRSYKADIQDVNNFMKEMKLTAEELLRQLHSEQ